MFLQLSEMMLKIFFCYRYVHLLGCGHTQPQGCTINGIDAVIVALQLFNIDSIQAFGTMFYFKAYFIMFFNRT